MWRCSTDIARGRRSVPGIPNQYSRCRGHTIAYAEEVGQAHVRVRLRAGDGTDAQLPSRFRSAGKPLGQALIANRGRSVHAAGTLSIDRWNGRNACSLRVIDVAIPEQGDAVGYKASPLIQACLQSPKRKAATCTRAEAFRVAIGLDARSAGTWRCQRPSSSRSDSI